MTIQAYKAAIKAAKTKDQLREISYKAFLQDDNALTGKRTLYDRVISLCIKREQELNLSMAASARVADSGR